MTILSRFCPFLRKLARNAKNEDYYAHKLLSPSVQKRNYCHIVQKELEVATFCDVEIEVPYNVRVKPLNVHKYHNCDKLIIQMHKDHENIIEYYINGNKVTITGLENREDVLCAVKAPVKANIKIKSEQDISVGYFHGDKLLLSSTNGNIFVDRFQGAELDVQAGNGDITLHSHIQAEKIKAQVLKNGSISGGRLQGLNLSLKTNKGNISVDSAYCEESIFVVENGNMNLNNVHKSCKLLLSQGDLNLSGFDGQLMAKVKKGNADVHLSRISGNCEVLLKEKGDFKLRLAESCLTHNRFNIISSNCEISDTVKAEVLKNGNTLTIKSDLDEQNCFNINCAKGDVFVETSSWHDMIKRKLNKSTV